jgi:small subunit ribosomal protein S1
MPIEQELENISSSHKEFKSLLEQDFKDRKLKENEIIKATVTEITKNFIVVYFKAKMEGMIPIEEIKNDNELSQIKIGSLIDVYLERIESFKGEIVISREKASKMKAWKIL